VLSGADAFSDDFPSEWQVPALDDSSSCQFDSNNRQFKLLKGKSLRLTLGCVAAVAEAALHSLALLVGDDGRPLSPVLTAVNGGSVPVGIDLDKLDDFEVSVMRNPAGDVVGGVIPLSADVQPEEEEDAEPQTLTAYLLLCTQLETTVYLVQEDGNEQGRFATLLENGLLTIQLNGTGAQALVEIGVAVAVKQDVTPRGLAITTAGKVFGVLVDRDRVGRPLEEEPGRFIAGSFEPREYLVQPLPEQPGLPADILADIRRNQAHLEQKVDALLGMIAAPVHLDHPLPPTPIAVPLMVEYLNQDQFRIWNVVREQCRGASAAHFQPEDIWRGIQNDGEGPGNLTEDAVRQQLDLFERMGLIVSVKVEQEAFYRLATPLDDATEKHRREDDVA
jgi:hypothetical protein